MTYIEIAVSDGPGTLVKHFATPTILGAVPDGEFIGANNKRIIAQTLTESEYQDFIAMHGGTVAT